MIPVDGGVRVFLAPGATDMRKSIDTLAILVAGQLDQDPLSGHLFGFCNRPAGYRQNPLLGPQRLLSVAQAAGAGPVPLAG